MSQKARWIRNPSVSDYMLYMQDYVKKLNVDDRQKEIYWKKEKQ